MMSSLQRPLLDLFGGTLVMHHAGMHSMTDWMHNNRIFGYIAPSFKTMQMGQAHSEE